MGLPDATMGRIGVGLQWDCVGRAQQRRFLEGLYNGSFRRSRLREGPSGTRTTGPLLRVGQPRSSDG